MTAIAIIRVTEMVDGIVSTSMQVDQDSCTEKELLMATLLDKAIGASLSAVIAHLQKTKGVSASLTTAATLEEAVARSLENVFQNG